MELEQLPEHLIVLGSGYIGFEFAQMFQRFGSPVTVIGHSEQILSNEDSDIAIAVTNRKVRKKRDQSMNQLLSESLQKVGIPIEFVLKNLSDAFNFYLIKTIITRRLKSCI